MFGEVERIRALQSMRWECIDRKTSYKGLRKGPFLSPQYVSEEDRGFYSTFEERVRRKGTYNRQQVPISDEGKLMSDPGRNNFNPFTKYHLSTML